MLCQFYTINRVIIFQLSKLFFQNVQEFKILLSIPSKYLFPV